MSETTQSPNRLKKRAKKAAALVVEDHSRLITRIQNLFELENWNTERIAEALEIPRSEVIRLIQHSQLDQTKNRSPMWEH